MRVYLCLVKLLIGCFPQVRAQSLHPPLLFSSLNGQFGHCLFWKIPVMRSSLTMMMLVSIVHPDLGNRRSGPSCAVGIASFLCNQGGSRELFRGVRV